DVDAGKLLAMNASQSTNRAEANAAGCTSPRSSHGRTPLRFVKAPYGRHTRPTFVAGGRGGMAEVGFWQSMVRDLPGHGMFGGKFQIRLVLQPLLGFLLGDPPRDPRRQEWARPLLRQARPEPRQQAGYPQGGAARLDHSAVRRVPRGRDPAVPDPAL